MTILFSPVGTADPITQLGDGPMLHIVRHCKPDKVVLFLSPEMQKCVHEDKANGSAADIREYGRYEAAIRRLCSADERPVPLIEAINSPRNEVYRFDYYIDEFERILSGLCKESPNEPVLVNATSGTPGFQQALVALGSFGRLHLKVLQVTTPKRGANAKQDREDHHKYDLETMWAWNEDLRESDPSTRESRVLTVVTPNFTNRLQRENVIKLVETYEYKAAYELACEIDDIDETAKKMLLSAHNRLNLYSALCKVFKRDPRTVYRSNDLLGEFLSVMQVRLEQGHWADFARLVTPAFTAISKKVLRESGLPEDMYLKRSRENKLDWEKVESDRRLKSVLGTRPGRSQFSLIKNWQLNELVMEYCQDRTVIDKVSKLRDFEEGCRHKVAHELQVSDKSTLERLGGLELETVLEYLFDLHGDVRPHLYEDINNAICSRL